MPITNYFPLPSLDLKPLNAPKRISEKDERSAYIHLLISILFNFLILSFIDT